MYKKLLILFSIITVAICCSGCVKYTTSIEITKKDEAIISQQYGISVKMLKMFNPEFSAEDFYENWDSTTNKRSIDRLKARGYSIKNLKDDEYIGKKIYKKFNKPKYISKEDLPDGIVIPAGTSNPIDIRKGVFGTSYVINLKFDPKTLQNRQDYFTKQGEENQTQQEENEITEEITEENANQEPQVNPIQNIIDTISQQPEFKPVAYLTVKIPKKANKHNATSFDKKTHEYKWEFNPEDLKKGKSVDIHIEYSKTNFLSIIFLLLVIALTINVVSKNEQYSKKESDETKEAF